MTPFKAALFAFLFACCTCGAAHAASTDVEDSALRVFIRAGEKTHGPGQHDHPRFLAEWTELLAERGAKVAGALRFPTADELAISDVLVMYAAEAATIEGAERERFDAFLARGGGLVLVHDAVCGTDPDWFNTRAGGAWEHGHSKWFEGKIGLYFAGPHEITRGVPHFDLDDEVYYDLHMSPDAQVLASGFHDIFNPTPQMWVVDKTEQRVFVTLQGHNHATFSHPAFRALLLRGIAWAGRRDVDLLTRPAELDGLRYPPGGPLAPEHAADAFVLNEEFDLELTAAEPLVVNPISLDWDPSGRLWIAQTPGYPYKQEFSGIPAHDEITILADSDGDGRMDRSTTFAGGLDLVTSFVFHEDGVIVTQAPDILWLRDTDGDDVADERIVLYTGFGYADTHATMSNLRWGLDGWIYGTQGYSGNDSRDIRSPYHKGPNGESQAYGAIPNGVFRFRPDGSAIEPFSVYGSNTWGLDFDPNGELFFTMANGSHLRHALLSEEDLGPNRIAGTRTWRDIVDHRKVQRISKADRAAYVQIDFVGGFTAASGCTIYSGGAWPQEFAGNHFVCEPTVNLVHRDVLRREGLSFVASKPRQAEFLASTDPWFRPVQTRVGPDGALYVLDFYNQAAVHNDTRGPKHGPTNAAQRPDRDRHHGRIWRVQHKRALAAPPAGANFPNAMRELRLVREGSERASDSPTFDNPLPALRVRALWTALHTGEINTEILQHALGDRDPAVRRAAARVAAELPAALQTPQIAYTLGLRTADRDESVQLAVFTALRHYSLMPMVTGNLPAVYLSLKSDLVRSAFLRVAQNELPQFIVPTIGLQEYSTEPAEAAAAQDLLRRLISMQARTADASAIVDTLEQLLGAGPGVAPALPGALRELNGSLPQGFEFGEQDARAGEAVVALMLAHAHDMNVQSALLPLATRVEATDEQQAAMRSATDHFLAVAKDDTLRVEPRLQALATLLQLGTPGDAVFHAADSFLSPHHAPQTQMRAVDMLTASGDPRAARLLARVVARVSSQIRERIFQELIVRPEWTQRLLDEIEEGELQPRELGAPRLFRLRQHADPAVAQRARTLLGEQNTSSSDFDPLIERLLPVVSEGGDPARGLEVFLQNCAVCHRHEGLPPDAGADVGPSLVGMGAHGRAQLLPFILDPNRSVEASYMEYICETREGQLLGGVLTYDGPDSITLASSSGPESIRRDQILSLASSGRSPMPTGFEALGEESLTDLLAFLCDSFEDYRVIPLRELFNASTQLGLYDRRHDAYEMRFTTFGVVDVMGVPMEVLDPARLTDNNNAIVLKGGARPEWQSKTQRPQRVEVPVGHALQRMHVLGGISAWGHPFFGEEDPAVRWTFHYVDGVDEVHILHDGIEFADWIGRHDVPGSEYVEGMLKPGSIGQVRVFSIDPARPTVPVERILLESFDNRTAPTFLALTAQVRGAEPRAPREPEVLTHPRALIVGGGSSHDWTRWFDSALQGTIAASDEFDASEVEFTTRLGQVLPRLKTLEVLVLTNNQEPRDAKLREGIEAFVERGGGLLILHAATWYNWPAWPAYNRDLVGGGARGHEAYGSFDVRVEDSASALALGIPATFPITDELYRFEPDSSGAQIHVIAMGTSRITGERYPVVWTVAHEGGRILCTTLGHDGAAHRSPTYQRLIQNAVVWLRESD